MVAVCEGNKVDPGTVVALDRDGDIRGVVVVGTFPDDLAVQQKGVAP